MMRTLFAAGVAIAALVTPAVDAQQMMHGPQPGSYPGGGTPYGYDPAANSRWGSKVDGHWWGGVNAPGGWHAYHRPYRGWTLPSYWVSPRFYIGDWSTYGLPQPPAGYEWSRYYDDAVLIDDRGSIYDTVGGINWDGYDSYPAGYAAQNPAYAPPAPAYPAAAPYPAEGYAGDGAGYAPPPGPGYAYPHRSSGVGGAIAGAAVGGVAGNLIAGRGNRLGGTLIGAGVGGLAGYAIDRGSSRGHYDRPPVAPAYPPAPPVYAQPAPPPPPPPPPVAPASGWSAPGGNVTVVTTGSYYGGSTTVVTVQTPPVLTTTTTDIYEDRVTYHAPVYRAHVYRPVHKVVRHVWRPRCGCR